MERHKYNVVSCAIKHNEYKIKLLEEWKKDITKKFSKINKKMYGKQ